MTLKTQEQSQRPMRRLTLLFIATGGTFGFLASIVGALALAEMSGVKLALNLDLFQDHAYLQIFGFLSEFVCGVGYSIIPLFSSKKLRYVKLSYLPYSLITIANALGIVGALLQNTPPYLPLFKMFSIFILVASSVFLYQIVDLLWSKPSKARPEADYFFTISAVSFVLVAIIFFMDTTFPVFLLNGGSELFAPPLLYTSLIGFVGSMIFGVELRTIVFRMTTYKRNFAKLAIIFQIVSIGMVFGSTFRGPETIEQVASIGFLISSLCFGISARIFESRKRSMTLLPLTSGRENVASHNSIARYTDACVTTAVLWLVFGCSLGAVWLIPGISASFAIRDSFIHSIAIGFIGSTIAGYAVVLLPGVLSSKAPKKHLSVLPLVFLNAGLIIRLAGSFYSEIPNVAATSLPVWESSSGLLVIISMALLMKELH